MQFLKNLRSLPVGHKSSQYLPQCLFFCGRLVGKQGQSLKLRSTMNGFQPNLKWMILLLGIEVFSVVPEKQVSLVIWVIGHLDALIELAG